MRPFLNLCALVKIVVKNGLNNLFGLWDQITDVSEQAVLNLKYLGLHDEEVKKINISDPPTATQSKSGSSLSFMITVHPDPADPKYKHSRMTCRACVQL